MFLRCQLQSVGLSGLSGLFGLNPRSEGLGEGGGKKLYPLNRIKYITDNNEKHMITTHTIYKTQNSYYLTIIVRSTKEKPIEIKNGFAIV